MIEITENQTLAVTPAIKELIRSLRNRGVMFALDDFGTGYANLCYLNELELDVIKIDKTFINAIQADNQPLPMLESIINLAMILGLRTVAEGVEYAYQREWLISKQVDYLQGYHFLPPVPFADFRRFVEQSQPATREAACKKGSVLPGKRKMCVLTRCKRRKPCAFRGLPSGLNGTSPVPSGPDLPLRSQSHRHRQSEYPEAVPPALS